MSSHVQDDTLLLLPKQGHLFTLRTSILLFLALIDLLASCGISQGFKNYMQDRLGYSLVATSSIISTSSSVGNIAPILGAYIGDQCWGPCRTIQVFGVWYVVSTLLLSFSAHPTILNEYLPLSNAIFLIVLFIGLPIGNGCFSSNLVILGADQLTDATPSQKQRYFSTFYLMRNIGSIIAFAYLSYLSVNGVGTWISPAYGYFATFILCTGMLGSALALFISYRSLYIKRQPQREAFTGFFYTIYASMQVCPDLKYIVAGLGAFLLSFLCNAVTILLNSINPWSQYLTYTAGILVFLGMMLWINYGMNPSFLDNQPTLSSIEISDMKQFLRLLPFASFLIIWLLMYDQFDTNYQSVTQQTDLRFGSGQDAPQIPGTMLCLFDPLGLLVILPLLDYVIFPWILRSRGHPPSPYEKVLFGLLFAVVNMLWTAQVEIWRRGSGLIELQDGLGPVLDNGSHQPMSNLPWTYMIPTYLMHSLCESLIQVTALDVFYTYVPEHLKCTAQATRAFMGAMGKNVASIFILGFASVLPDDLNHGHMEYLYYCLAAIALLNGLGFAHVMRKMKIGMEVF